MKTLVLRFWCRSLVAAGCLLALTLFASSAAVASPLFNGDFETGNLGQWNHVQALPGRITTLTSPVAQGLYAGRFEVRAGDEEPETHQQRAEVISGLTYSEGQTRYFHLRSRIGSWDYGHWGIIWQLHDQSSGSPPVSLQLMKQGTTPVLWLGNGKEGGPEYWDAPLPGTEQWFELTIKVTFGSKGSLRVWLNGEPQLMANGGFIYEGIDTLGVGPAYDKLGVYRSFEAATTAVVYHDDYQVSESPPLATKFGSPTLRGHWSVAPPLQLGDINGDGRADLLGRNSSSDIQVGLSGVSAFEEAHSWGPWASELSLLFGDVTGDGKVDAIGVDSKRALRIAESNGTTLLASSGWGTAPDHFVFQLADLNGDGRADAVGQTGTDSLEALLSSGTGFGSADGWGSWSSAYSLDFADVNGDGRSDAVGKGSNVVKAALSTGKKIGSANTWGSWPSGYSLDFADVNGDGRSDAVGKDASGAMKVALSGGTSFGTANAWGSWPSGYSLDFADFNGDRRADAVGTNSAGQVVVAWAE
ncbi:MAG: heparin lyase I family protein [Solirubrobacterales bacterium]